MAAIFCRIQGCQIFLGAWYQDWKKCTKWTQNVPNGHKSSHTYVRKIFQMYQQYINIYQSQALQIYPNWDFWFEKKPSCNPGRI
jgi:hypothetical protein